MHQEQREREIEKKGRRVNSDKRSLSDDGLVRVFDSGSGASKELKLLQQMTA